VPQTCKIEIFKISGFKINDVVEHLSFGSVLRIIYSNVILKNGKWQQPVIKPLSRLLLDPSSRVFITVKQF
jgi:hypothetical protein